MIEGQNKSRVRKEVGPRSRIAHAGGGFYDIFYLFDDISVHNEIFCATIITALGKGISICILMTSD